MPTSYKNKNAPTSYLLLTVPKPVISSLSKALAGEYSRPRRYYSKADFSGDVLFLFSKTTSPLVQHWERRKITFHLHQLESTPQFSLSGLALFNNIAANNNSYEEFQQECAIVQQFLIDCATKNYTPRKLLSTISSPTLPSSTLTALMGHLTCSQSAQSSGSGSRIPEAMLTISPLTSVVSFIPPTSTLESIYNRFCTWSYCQGRPVPFWDPKLKKFKYKKQFPGK